LTEASKAKGRPRRDLRSRLGSIVPPIYLEPGGRGWSLAKTFALALVVRLILMPIASHSDLLSTYHRSFLLSREVQPSWWTPHELIQAAVLALASPLLPLPDLLGWEGSFTASSQFWLEVFAQHPMAFLALFVFKLPYLLGDLAVALVLLRLFSETPAQGIAAAKMWLLNPITIFTFYVFGRHDAIAILFIALGLLWLERGQSLRGAVSFGVAIWSRYYAALLLPFLVALHPGSWRKKSGILAAALVPMLAFNVATSIYGESGTMTSYDMIANRRFSDYLLTFHLDMGSTQILFVFPMLCALLFLSSLVAPQRNRFVVRFSAYAACFLLVFYATAFFHPQYVSWSILFLVILRAEEKGRVLGKLHYLQILLFLPYTFYWGEPLFGWLLAPLNPEFFGAVQSPWVWIGSFGDPKLLVNLARSLMSAVCLFMAGWILVDFRMLGLRATQAAVCAPETDGGLVR
jgi:hypothetical protein